MKAVVYRGPYRVAAADVRDPRMGKKSSGSADPQAASDHHSARFSMGLMAGLTRTQPDGRPAAVTSMTSAGPAAANRGRRSTPTPAGPACASPADGGGTKCRGASMTVPACSSRTSHRSGKRHRVRVHRLRVGRPVGEPAPHGGPERHVPGPRARQRVGERHGQVHHPVTGQQVREKPPTSGWWRCGSFTGGGRAPR